MTFDADMILTCQTTLLELSFFLLQVFVLNWEEFTLLFLVQFGLMKTTNKTCYQKCHVAIGHVVNPEGGNTYRSWTNQNGGEGGVAHKGGAIMVDLLLTT